jgi:hypothetical protein
MRWRADFRLPVQTRRTGVDNDRDEDRDEDGGATRIGRMIETKMGTEICAGGPTSACLCRHGGQASAADSAGRGSDQANQRRIRFRITATAVIDSTIPAESGSGIVDTI